MTLGDRVKWFLEDTITIDDPRKPRRKPKACRECEIVASASFLSGSIYIGHLTRLGKITPTSGITIASLLGIASLAMIMRSPQDENLNKLVDKYENQTSDISLDGDERKR
uniref:Uncharacterized protein n=1 Tax=Ciona intestinalis TaxID=7719 RepID=H2XVE7_CIOIN